MSIIEKYIQQTKDQNGNVVGFGFKGNIQNLIQEVEDLEASMVNEENFNALKEENALLHKINNESKQTLEIIEIYCQKTSDDEQAMSGEHLACDDVLELIKKYKRDTERIISNADKT